MDNEYFSLEMKENDTVALITLKQFVISIPFVRAFHEALDKLDQT